MLQRPCFIVLDTEHASSISSRKLVLETAKYNVITAYSCGEAVATLHRFPAVDALVLNGALRMDPDYVRFADVFAKYPDVKVILVGDLYGGMPEHRVDVQVEGFAPGRLLDQMQKLFPALTRQINERELELEKDSE